MEIKNIKMDEIKIRENSRLKAGDITGLSKSIKESGLLQPIIVKELKNKNNGYNYQIVVGHRRYAAIQKLKWEKIPCIVYPNMNDVGVIVRNLMENLQREDVSAAEIGRYYHNLMNEYNYTPEDISKKLGIPICRIKTAIDVYSYVPKEYRDKVKFIPSSERKSKDTIPATTAKSILEIEREQRLTVDAKSALFDAVMEGKLSNDKMKLAGVFLKYGMDIKDVIKLVDEYDIVRVYIPIKKKEIEQAMDKNNISSKRKLFRDILAGDLKITFNIPKWTES